MRLALYWYILHETFAAMAASSSSSKCAMSSPAPARTLYAAMGVLVLLALVLAFQYLIRPVLASARAPPPPAPETFWADAPKAAKPAKAAKAAAPRAKLVFLHMNGCGWCVKFRPTWDDLLKRDGPALARAGLELVDYEASSAGARMYQELVQGYPTVLLDKSGKSPVVFEGDRTRDALLQFAASHGYAAKGGREDFRAPETGLSQLSAASSKTVKDAQVSEAQQEQMGESVGAKLPDPYNKA